MSAGRARPFLATLRNLRRHPLTEPEVEGLTAHLAGLETEVERLGEVASRERADVDWVENPFVRLGLWLGGTLEEREARERAEYDAAMAATLATGDAARKLRTWLDALPDARRVDDERVVSDLEALRPEDLDGLVEDGAALRALVARVHQARELQAIGRLCKQLSAQLGLPRRGRARAPIERAFERIRGRLRAADQRDLADRLANSPDEADGDRARLGELRDILGARIRARRTGVATALLDIVREHHHPPGGWEPLDAALRPGAPR